MKTLRTTVLATLCATTPMVNAMTIAEAKLLPPSTPVTIDNVVVTSIVDLVNNSTLKSFHIRDTFNMLPWENQAGATVFASNAEVDAVLSGVSVGNTITLSGITISFNGLFEIGGDATNPLIRIARTPGSFVPPSVNTVGSDYLDMSQTAEGLESKVLRLNNVQFTAPGVFGVASYQVTDGTNLITVRVPVSTMNLVGTTIPTNKVDLSGVLTQFDSSDPRDGGYQLTLRTLADISPVLGYRVVGILAPEMPVWQMAYDSTPADNAIEVEFRGAFGTILASGSYSPSTGHFWCDVPPGVTSAYHVSVKVGPHLRSTFPTMDLPGLTLGDANLGTLSTLSGDADNDNEVGPGDFGALSSAFGLVLGDSGFDPMIDFDADGEIGPSDFGTLSSNFGSAGDE